MQQNVCVGVFLPSVLLLQQARLLEHIKNCGVTLLGKLTAEVQHAMKTVLKQWGDVQNADCTRLLWWKYVQPLCASSGVSKSDLLST